MEIVIKAGIGSKSQMFQFITEIFYSCLWPAPHFGRQNAVAPTEHPAGPLAAWGFHHPNRGELADVQQDAGSDGAPPCVTQEGEGRAQQRV